MSGTNNAGKVESLSLDRFRFVQIMIYIHMFPFFIWFKPHCSLQRFWSSCKTSCQCSRRTREFTNIPGSWTGANIKKKTGPKFEWSTIKNYDQVLNIEIVQILAFSVYERNYYGKLQICWQQRPWLSVWRQQQSLVSMFRLKLGWSI